MESVARKMVAAIHATLDGIERCPRMYGDWDAAQGQYEVLLGVLAAGYEVEPRAIRDITRRVTHVLLGEGNSAPLSARASTETQFVEGLKRIRAGVEELLSGPCP